MSSRVVNLKDNPEPVSRYAPSRKAAGASSDAGDRVDAAGQTILGLLNRVADVADENSKHALEIAHKLSRQLRAAEERIADLEADLRHYQSRAERAEQWLQHISAEIEQRFFDTAEKVRA
jgi:DNA repair ATPase RecN